MGEFQGFLTTSVKSIDAALSKTGIKDVFGEPVIGDVQFSRLDYPTIHIIPDDNPYVGGGLYEETIFVNFYFTKGKDSSKYLSNSEDVEDTIDDILDELSKDENIEYKVQDIRSLAGQPDNTNTHIQGFELELLISKVIDYSNV